MEGDKGDALGDVLFLVRASNLALISVVFIENKILMVLRTHLYFYYLLKILLISGTPQIRDMRVLEKEILAVDQINIKISFKIFIVFFCVHHEYFAFHAFSFLL